MKDLSRTVIKGRNKDPDILLKGAGGAVAPPPPVVDTFFILFFFSPRKKKLINTICCILLGEFQRLYKRHEFSPGRPPLWKKGIAKSLIGKSLLLLLNVKLRTKNR
jgi:hypothetical protein